MIGGGYRWYFRAPIDGEWIVVPEKGRTREEHKQHRDRIDIWEEHRFPDTMSKIRRWNEHGGLLLVSFHSRERGGRESVCVCEIGCENFFF